MIGSKKHNKSWPTYKERLWQEVQLISALFVIFILTACYGNCLPTDEVRELLTSQLHIGDSREKIEAVLNNVGATYYNPPKSPPFCSYDKFNNAYHSMILDEPRCGPYQAISVTIQLDNQGRLSSIEVSESYTMP
jgi:hypothetical protein